jgi:hypothetical protein
MKVKFIVLSLLVTITNFVLADNQDSLKSKLPISIKAGYKAPSERNYHSTNSGFGFSISTGFRLSERFTLNPSFILWTSKYKYINPYHENITVTNISVLLGYQFDINEFTIEPKVGFGLGKASDTNKQLLTTLYGLGINYNYDRDIKLQLDIIKQNSSAFDVGGTGPSFDNVLILFGFEFTL